MAAQHIPMTDRATMDQLADAFRTSLSLPPRPEPALMEWIDALSVYTRSRLPRTELNVANKCKRLSDQARDRIRHYDQLGAYQLLAMAASLADNSSLSEESRYLCLAEIAPAELYVEHLCRNWESAWRLLAQALHADQALEDTYGYSWKVGHRVHLLTVAAEMTAEQSRTNDATKRIVNIVSYLAGRSADIDAPGDWQRSRLECLSPGMRDVLAMQALRAWLPFFAGCAGGSRDGLLEVFAASLSSCVDSTSHSDSTPGYSVNEYIRLLISALVEPEMYLRECPRALLHGGYQSVTFSLAFDAASSLSEHYDVRSTLPIEVWRLAQSGTWFAPVRSQWFLRLNGAASSGYASRQSSEASLRGNARDRGRPKQPLQSQVS